MGQRKIVDAGELIYRHCLAIKLGSPSIPNPATAASTSATKVLIWLNSLMIALHFSKLQKYID
jgi:hypothetical protein